MGRIGLIFQEAEVNVFDDAYRDAITVIPGANLALFAVIDYVRTLFGLEPQSKVVTGMSVTKGWRQLLALDLVDIDISTPAELSAYRAYVEHGGAIDLALSDLASHGCRGNELAFICLRELGGRRCFWALADLATMQPVNVQGELVRSESFFW